MTNSVHHRCPQCGGPSRGAGAACRTAWWRVTTATAAPTCRATGAGCCRSAAARRAQARGLVMAALRRARAGPRRGDDARRRPAVGRCHRLVPAQAAARSRHGGAARRDPGTHLEGERLPEAHPLKTLLPAQAMEVEPRATSRKPAPCCACAATAPGACRPQSLPRLGGAGAADGDAVADGGEEDRCRHPCRPPRRPRDDPQRRHHGPRQRTRIRRPTRRHDLRMTLCADTRVNFKGNHREKPTSTKRWTTTGRSTP